MALPIVMRQKMAMGAGHGCFPYSARFASEKALLSPATAPGSRSYPAKSVRCVGPTRIGAGCVAVCGRCGIVACRRLSVPAGRPRDRASERARADFADGFCRDRHVWRRVAAGTVPASQSGRARRYRCRAGVPRTQLTRPIRFSGAGAMHCGPDPGVTNRHRMA